MTDKSSYEMWKRWNIFLNALRNLKGVPLRPANENPYKNFKQKMKKNSADTEKIFLKYGWLRRK